MVDLEEFANDWVGFPEDDIESGDYYFNSYSHFGIQEEMLKDSSRTGAFRSAILQNTHLFFDKIVLDLGCGTGIMAMFAVQAGAKLVYAIDQSAIIFKAKQIAKDNKMEDKIIFIRDKVEDATLPEKVDIIISEWIGYFCLYESMLDSVIFARDKWLKPGGLIFPDRVNIYIAGIEDGEYKAEKLDSWRSFYGLDFSSVIPTIMHEPIIDTVDHRALVTNSYCILKIDVNKWRIKDSDFCAEYKIIANKKEFMHAFVFWFDIIFSQCHVPIHISTSPNATATHWKQTVFYIKDNMPLEKGDVITGVLCVRKNKDNKRDLDVKMSYHGKGKWFQATDCNFYRIR